MKGHIPQAAKNSWSLKSDAGRPNDGVRKIKQEVGAAIKGTSRQEVH